MPVELARKPAEEDSRGPAGPAEAQAQGKEAPEDKAQRNFTDPGLSHNASPGGKESANLTIVSGGGQRPSGDCGGRCHQPALRPGLGPTPGADSNTGTLPREASADAGYYSAQAVAELYALGVDPFIPPDKTRHGTVIPSAPRGRIPSIVAGGPDAGATQRGRQHALRMGTVEPVFGQIKQARGFRQFLLRGLEKVKLEWKLICAGHNLPSSSLP